jgi:hypothetical protein
LTPLPEDTTVVFSFLAGPYMKRMKRHLAREATRLGHEIRFVSYGFALPGLTAEKHEPFLIYRFKP